MKYRPVAPSQLDEVVTKLESLMASTVVPWKFDAEANAFYIEQNGQKLFIEFGEGDAETALVLLMIEHLPLLIAALEKRFYFLRLEGTTRG